MGEVEEQRYVCKICGKSCVSGKSLGGHMRVHLSLISASKKAAQVKIEGKREVEDCDNQSNSTALSEDKMKNCNREMDFGDFDLNNSYELRNNSKKSWRISKERASCKECGKDFPSLRALSSHVRSHSMKNGEVHNCKKCGKGFDSMRAMFGHMKSHSKKLRGNHDNEDSLSDFENLCPVRRKRLRIKYGVAPNCYGSSLHAWSSGVSEVGDVEEAAACLVMLSRGLRDSNGIDSIPEFSDDDSVYFGGESSCKSKKIDKKDEGFVCVSNEISKMSGLIEKKVDESDDLDSSFAVENEMKIGFAYEELFCVENETNVDKLKDLSKTNESKLIHGFDFRKDSRENVADDLGIDQESEGASITRSLESNKSKEHECPICLKVFLSGPALGGHKRAHYKGVAENITNETMTVNQEMDEIYNGFDLNFPVSVDDGVKGDLGVNLSWVETGFDREALVLTN